jgi:hypothetical protein
MQPETTSNRGAAFWAVQGPGWVLLVYLVIVQGIPAFDYEIGVRMGSQEPATAVTEIGVAFWKGFAVADLITYIPLLAAGLVGHWTAKSWSRVVLGAALGVTVYWPAVCLSTVVAAHGLEGWHLANESAYRIVLPAISLWGAFGLWQMIVQE